MIKNDSVLELQKLNNILNTKYTCCFNGVFNLSDPVYILPQPKILPSGRNYRAAMIYYSCDNYFENISPELNNNYFYYSSDKGRTWKDIKLERGYYDIDEYNNEIYRQMKVNVDAPIEEKKPPYISISINLSMYKTIIEINHDDYIIDFEKSKTFRNNLGFESNKLKGKGRYVATHRIQITHVKQINLHCDLIVGGFNNEGKETDIIISYPTGEFPPGQIVAIRPTVPLFLPVKKDVIDIIRF